MAILYSLTLQTSNGALFSALRQAGAHSLEVLTEGTFVFKDPAQIKIGDIVRTGLGSAAQRSTVVDMAKHDKKWESLNSQRMVNIAGSNGAETLQWSVPLTRLVWVHHEGNPVQRPASELKLDDIVWFEVASKYGKLYYTNN